MRRNSGGDGTSMLLPDVLARRAGEQPDAPFLEELGNENRLSYGGFRVSALRWSAAFAAAGVGPGSHVVSMLPTGIRALEVWLGLAWAGAVEVPVNPAYRGRMLEYVLRDSRATVVVCDRMYLERLEELDPSAFEFVEQLILCPGDAGVRLGVQAMGEAEFLAAGGEPRPFSPQAHDVASIIYTSGTTGLSKGVMVPWGQVLATTRGSVPVTDIEAEDAYFNPFPLYHISGKFPISLMAICGGRVVLREVFSTDDFWADIAAGGCTTTLLLGAMANFIFRQPERPGESDLPLKNVIMVPLIPEMAEFAERFGVRICTTFNMTEVSSPLGSQGWAPANAETCGQPRPGVECAVVDEHDYPVPAGEIGELVVRSERPWEMMTRYWGKPEATAEALRNQWLHTGDAFRRDEDDNFYFVDRFKDAIRRRGENISSAEVEADVNRHPAVLESAAIAVSSEWGEDDVMVVVVPKPGAELDPAELIGFLAERMAHFMVPRYVELAAELPKTETQKIRKAELRERGVTDSTFDREQAGIEIKR